MYEAVRETIGCLIDSPYRGPLLLELRDGPADRGELRDAVDASRATISRALATFERRDWVRHTGQEYRLTALGRLVASEFDELVTTMETMHDLRGVVEHLPMDDVGFDVSHLRDATVVRSTSADPLAPFRHADRFVADATTLSMLSHAFTPGVIEVIGDRAAAGVRTTAVVTPSVVESLANDDALRAKGRELAADDDVDFRLYDGTVPYVLAIGDGTVSLGVADEDGRVVAVVDTDDETVLAWAEETVASHRARARPVTPADLDPTDVD